MHSMQPGSAVSKNQASTQLGGCGMIVGKVLPPSEVVDPSGVLVNLAHRVWRSSASDIICSASHRQ